MFCEKVNGRKPLTIFAKLFFLNIWEGSEYASASYVKVLQLNFNWQLPKPGRILFKFQIIEILREIT